MNIISASYVITCDDNFSVIENGAIVYNDKIIEVDTFENIKNKYQNIKIKKLDENSVLMPGLINSHVHLEFSSNTTTLKYGNFKSWLDSVIKNRDDLISSATSQLISNKLNEMKKTGTTTIGAISSYGFDMQACIDSPLNTVFFCEAIGSKADMVDTLFSDFKSRLSLAQKKSTKKFIPAVAIHSAYSVHPFLIREVLNLAREQNLAVSAHFLESKEESEWLNKNQGKFLDFFMNFFKQSESFLKPYEFLNLFSNIHNLSFTHCVEADFDSLEKIKKLNASINHCVTSNRLLNNTKLDLSKLNNIPFTIATDGLSSNNSLSMFDEIRNCLMAHYGNNIVDFSQVLLKAATSSAGKTLGLNKGILQKNFDCDIISFKLPNKLEYTEDLCAQVILHTKFVDDIIIGGKYV